MCILLEQSKIASHKIFFSYIVVLVVAVCYLGHPKNWLIDWLIDWFLTPTLSLTLILTIAPNPHPNSTPRKRETAK